MDRRALRAVPVQHVAVWALLLLCMLRMLPKGQLLLILLAMQARLLKVLRSWQEGPEGCSCQVIGCLGAAAAVHAAHAAQGPFAACFLLGSLLRAALTFLSLIFRLAMLLP